MKKYLTGVFAAVLAIMFSSFTTTKQSPKVSTETLYYWHTNGTSLGTYVGPFMDRSDAVEESECEDDGSNVCARGYTLDQLVDETPNNPPKVIGDFGDQINKVE